LKINKKDRFVGWILNSKIAPFVVGLLYLMLPPTGKGLSSTKDWNDQNLFWQGVINLQEKNDSTWSHDGWVGPGYVGLIRLISRIFGIDASNAMVLTNRLCFAIAAVFISLSIQSLLSSSKVTVQEKTRIITASLIGFAVIPVFTYSDIPWTNFLTYAIWSLAVYLLFLMKNNKMSNIKNSAAIFSVGFLAFYARQVREADGLILMIFGFIFISLNIIPEIKARIIAKFEIAQKFTIYILGMISSWIFVGLLAGNFTIFSQYWKVEEIFPGFKDLYFTGLISRFVGVFVDPCYNSYCPDNSYTGILDDVSRIWSQPILLQIASLGPVILILTGILVRVFFKFKLNLNLMYFILFVGTGVTFIVGYTSLTVLNGSVIKFGTSREYFLPTMLLLLALIFFLSTSSEITFNTRLLTNSFSFLTVLMVLLALTVGLPRWENSHVEKVSTSLNLTECPSSTKCRVKMESISVNFQRKILSTQGWVEAIYKPKFIEDNGITTTGISIQEVIPGKKTDVYRKWYKMSENGILPKEIMKGIGEKGIYTLHFVPIDLGVQGTPTHTKHIEELTIHFEK
jgi:hypothetical protein